MTTLLKNFDERFDTMSYFFFKDLCYEERVKFYKTFGWEEAIDGTKMNHGIERRILRAIFKDVEAADKEEA